MLNTYKMAWETRAEMKNNKINKKAREIMETDNVFSFNPI